MVGEHAHLAMPRIQVILFGILELQMTFLLQSLLEAPHTHRGLKVPRCCRLNVVFDKILSTQIVKQPRVQVSRKIRPGFGSVKKHITIFILFVYVGLVP